MGPGLYIADFRLGNVLTATDPDKLRTISASWREAADSFAPWQRIESAGPDAADQPLLWRAEHFRRNETILICGACTSTMDVARRFAQMELLSPWSSVLSVAQTGGRGQRGRQWLSPTGNVYGSWRWPGSADSPAMQKNWRNLSSLLAGGIVASVLEEIGLSVQLKWPNDLIVENRKLGGILLEDRNGVLVAGIGLNVTSSPDDKQLRNDFALPAVDLNTLGIEITPLDFWIRLVTSGRQFYDRMTLHVGPAAYIEWLQGKMAWIGETVHLQSPGSEIATARIEGLAHDGGLRINQKGRRSVIYNGSICIK